MKIEISESAYKTPAFALIAEGWNEMVQASLTTDGQALWPVGGDDTVLYTTLDSGEVVGVLVLASEGAPYARAARVTLAYVEPSMRKKGVFKAMLAAALDVAKSKQMSKVSISCSPDAGVMQLVMRKFDIPVATVTYELGV